MLCDLLAELKEASGMTQEETADACALLGVRIVKTAVGNYIQGTRRPDNQTLGALLTVWRATQEVRARAFQLLGVPAEDLVGVSHG